MKTTDFAAGMISGAMCAALATYGCNRGTKHNFEEIASVADTVRIVDTLRIERPVERWRTVVRKEEHSLPAADSRDTVRVTVPIERLTYETADYRAVVSGYEARLDTLVIRRELQRVSTVTSRAPSRWGVSVTAGVALTPRGVQPMVGVGVSYRLAAF